MARTLSAKMTHRPTHTMTKPVDLSTPTDELAWALTAELATGTGSGQANDSWHDRRQLLAVAEDVDLFGSETNVFGETVAFDNIKCLLIVNRNEVSGEYLMVGGAAANTFDTWVGDPSDEVSRLSLPFFGETPRRPVYRLGMCHHYNSHSTLSTSKCRKTA